MHQTENIFLQYKAHEYENPLHTVQNVSEEEIFAAFIKQRNTFGDPTDAHHDGQSQIQCKT